MKRVIVLIDRGLIENWVKFKVEAASDVGTIDAAVDSSSFFPYLSFIFLPFNLSFSSLPLFSLSFKIHLQVQLFLVSSLILKSALGSASASNSILSSFPNPLHPHPFSLSKSLHPFPTSLSLHLCPSPSFSSHPFETYCSQHNLKTTNTTQQVCLDENDDERFKQEFKW